MNLQNSLELDAYTTMRKLSKNKIFFNKKVSQIADDERTLLLCNLLTS